MAFNDGVTTLLCIAEKITNKLIQEKTAIKNRTKSDTGDQA